MIYRVIEYKRPDPNLNLTAVYSQINNDLREVRKVCVFTDGNMGRADDKHCFGCLLAERKIQPMTEDQDGERSSVRLIDQEIFETIWNKALMSPYPTISPWVINETYETSFEEAMREIYGP